MTHMVTLLDPSMCKECRFARVATVQDSGGNTSRMLHCTRRDCDNWQREERPIPLHIISRGGKDDEAGT